MKDVIILGAGPAGLAAAIKLSENKKNVIVFEKDSQVGGLSKTINYKGFLFDLGPHRFFTKSKEVNDLWFKTLGGDFLTVNRLTRIYYKNKFFFYPLKPMNILFGLGFFSSIAIIGSFIKAKVFPCNEEKNFRQWVTNNFGQKLYEIFFKTYTEKLWGIPCEEIDSIWAAQRIKGLSLKTIIKDALLPNKNRKVRTLIDRFYYPKYGAGMMYEKMAENAMQNGAEIIIESEVKRIYIDKDQVKSVVVRDKNGRDNKFFANHFISSIPLPHLVKIMVPKPNEDILTASNNLKFRSTVMVNLIYGSSNPFPDNWIYVHSDEVRTGRITSPKNMSKFTLPAENKTSLVLEYWCNENDEIWKTSDEQLIELGINDLEKLELANKKNFLDGFVVRVPKTYPIYNRTYKTNLEKIKNFLITIKNLQTIGRYGMFKYNNMDHSILTGLYAAENIIGERKHNIWEVNTEEEYYEEGDNMR